VSPVLTRRLVTTGTHAQVVTKRRVKTGDTREELFLTLGDAVAELFPERSLRRGAERGVAPAVLDRLDPPPLRPWLFFTGVGVTAGAGIAMAVMFGLQLDAQGRYQALAQRALTEEVDGAALVAIGNEARLYNAAGYAMLVTGLSLAAASAVAFLFTDWHSDDAVVPLLGLGGDGAALGLAGRF